MMVDDPRLLAMAARIGVFILMISMALTVYCIARGPDKADRVIALDLLSILVVALVALLSIYRQEAAFLDVAIAYALVAFLGTVAFARYLERSQIRDKRSGDREDTAHE